MKRSRVLLRLAGASMILAALTGPSPGHVGGCTGGLAVADAEVHCSERRRWRCERERAAGRQDDAWRDECLANIPGMCTGAQWPSGCQPTQAQSDNCIELLRDLELLGTETDELFRLYADCDLCE